MGEDNAYGSGLGGGQGAGTPPASDQQVSEPAGSQPEGQEQIGNEQQVITRKDLDALIAKVKEETLDEATRRAQSMTDKLGSRVDKEIQSALNQAKQSIELIKEGGVTLTPQQEQAIRDKAINRAYMKLDQEKAGSSPEGSGSNAEPAPDQNPGNQVNPVVQMINAEVQKIMQETGVFISPQEADQFILGENGENQLTPFEYVAAFRSLAQQRQQNNMIQSRGRNPNVSSYATGGSSVPNNSVLMQQYTKEKQAIANGTHPTIKRGQTKAIQDLEISYRKKGLDI